MDTVNISEKVISFINDYESTEGYQNRKKEGCDYVWECLLAEVYFRDSVREQYENGAEVGDFSAKIIDYYPSFDEMKADNGNILTNAIHAECSEADLHSICVSDRNSDGDNDYYMGEF